MKIGAFAELTGISAYTLRYYEKKGLLFVKRGQNGCRNYLAEDREWVQFLCKLNMHSCVIMGTVLLPSGWSFC